MRVEGDREELMAAGAAAWAKLCAVRGGADPEVALHDPDDADTYGAKARYSKTERSGHEVIPFSCARAC